MTVIHFQRKESPLLRFAGHDKVAVARNDDVDVRIHREARLELGIVDVRGLRDQLFAPLRLLMVASVRDFVEEHQTRGSNVVRVSTKHIFDVVCVKEVIATDDISQLLHDHSFAGSLGSFHNESRSILASILHNIGHPSHHVVEGALIALAPHVQNVIQDRLCKRAHCQSCSFTRMRMRICSGRLIGDSKSAPQIVIAQLSRMQPCISECGCLALRIELNSIQLSTCRMGKP